MRLPYCCHLDHDTVQSGTWIDYQRSTLKAQTIFWYPSIRLGCVLPLKIKTTQFCFTDLALKYCINKAHLRVFQPGLPREIINKQKRLLISKNPNIP